jgi:hypothetical protein
MHYWTLVIFPDTFQAQRFETESEAIAYARVHARLPGAELVEVDAWANGKPTTIWEWGEVEERWH